MDVRQRKPVDAPVEPDEGDSASVADRGVVAQRAGRSGRSERHVFTLGTAPSSGGGVARLMPSGYGRVIPESHRDSEHVVE